MRKKKSRTPAAELHRIQQAARQTSNPPAPPADGLTSSAEHFAATLAKFHQSTVWQASQLADMMKVQTSDVLRDLVRRIEGKH